MISPAEIMNAETGWAKRRFKAALAPLGNPCPFSLGSPAAAPRPSNPLGNPCPFSLGSPAAAPRPSNPLGNPCPFSLGSPAAAPRPSSPLAHDFAEESLGPEDQDEDEDREGEDVLVLGAEGPAGEQREIGRGERF